MRAVSSSPKTISMPERPNSFSYSSKPGPSLKSPNTIKSSFASKCCNTRLRSQMHCANCLRRFWMDIRVASVSSRAPCGALDLACTPISRKGPDAVVTATSKGGLDQRIGSGCASRSTSIRISVLNGGTVSSPRGSCAAVITSGSYSNAISCWVWFVKPVIASRARRPKCSAKTSSAFMLLRRGLVSGASMIITASASIAPKTAPNPAVCWALVTFQRDDQLSLLIKCPASSKRLLNHSTLYVAILIPVCLGFLPKHG